MKIIGLLQARDLSQRLPGKALMDINGIPMILHVYRRMLAAKTLDEVVVSTSVDSPNIVRWCKLNEVEHYVGSENDLLARHLNTVCAFKADAMVRVTADCPFHDPSFIDLFVKSCLEPPGTSFAANWPDRTVSEGLDLVWVTQDGLWMLHGMEECPREDYASWWIVARGGGWQKRMDWDPASKVPLRVGADLHLSVDTITDLDRARRMMKKLGNEEFRYEKTLKAYEATK